MPKPRKNQLLHGRLSIAENKQLSKGFKNSRDNKHVIPVLARLICWVFMLIVLR